MTQDEIIRMAREAGFSVGLNDPVIYAAHKRFAALVSTHERERQAEQEPIRFIWNGEGWIEADDYIWKTTDDHERRIFYAAPVRTKDLTDAELDALWYGDTEGGWRGLFRAVIAADREKNK